MINIDRVYQTVLAMADKEQRGYITPQEFNLLANQAQLEIFEQYFYDKNKVNRMPANETEYSDLEKILNEKIQIFDTGPVLLTYSGGGFSYPSSSSTTTDLWRLGTVLYGMGGLDDIVVQEIDRGELVTYGKSKLTEPTLSRPVYVRRNKRIMVYPAIITNNIAATYIRTPKQVSWGYFVMEGKALYDSNPNKTTHFELHHSDQSELIYKILKLAGFTLQQDQLVAGAHGLEMSQVQQEK